MDMSGTDSSTTPMSMTFLENKNTPLWLQAFTPVTDADYAGAIIGLILLGVANRGISAGRYLCAKYSSARTEINAELKGKGQSPSEEEERSTMAFSTPPFKWRYDIPRALIAGLEAFTGYLLMLAVMTFDVGYFFAVIGGIMLGELVFGRYILGASVIGHNH
ncbi:Ctr copper transporter [Umbelopsis sp. PMI_123]|nr:Ctr copper transporter [Umbelopsis sp. PMI_123]